MAERTAATGMVTIGLDLGDRRSEVYVAGPGGELVEAGSVATTEPALRRRFSREEGVRVVIEVGTHSPWVSRVLRSQGHEVIVASAGRVREMVGDGDKTDRIDARLLARFGQVAPDLLKAIRHRGEQAQKDLAVIRARDAVVRSRALLINHVRSVVKAIGGRIAACSTRAFHKRARESLPEGLEPVVEPVLEVVEQMTQQIRAYDRRIEKLCAERYPVTALLQQIRGVGPVTALCFVLTIEDPERFAKSRSVGAFLGLRPRKFASGGRDPELRITKKGDELLRRLLVQAAHYILGPFGPDTDLRRWGLRLAAGGKRAKKRAIVAVARKLAVLLHRLWTTGEVYAPLRKSSAADPALAA